MLNKIKARSLMTHIGICALMAFMLDGVLGLPFIGWWFIVINIFEFLIFGKDKLCAKMKWHRTPEMTFLTMGFIGAFPAILAGRKAFKHKTIKKEFIIPMWILFFAQIIVVIYYINNAAK